MARPVLLLTGKSYYRDGYIEQHWPLLAERCEIQMTDADRGPELTRLLGQADVVVPRRCTLDRAALEAAGRLRGIVTPGVGVEKVDVAAATELGIVVANSPGNSVTVAESTILLALALAKRMPMWIEAARNQRESTSGMRGMELRGKTLGLVGLGRIGRLTAELGRAFGMRVLAYDPYVPPSDQAELLPLEAVLRESDFVSLHPVLT